MSWQDLVVLLARHVPEGSLTTYAAVSVWAYGNPSMNQPVRSMLRGAVNHGFQTLTNRVVAADGRLADLPEGAGQQRVQLESEGVSFDANGRIVGLDGLLVKLPRSSKGES